MFVEQRIYTAHPGKLPAWLQLYEAEAAPVSARHMGPLLGFFTTEFGPLNKAVFFRAYDDIDDRARGMAAREADPAWTAFRQKSAALGALREQEAKLLKTTAFSPIRKAGQPFERRIGGTTMIVDHRTYDFHPGKANAWIEAYETLALPVQTRHLGQLLLFAVTECGPINQAVFMWAYEGLGDRDRRRAAMAADPGWAEFVKATAGIGALKQQTNMILKPTAFSPIR
ncbi:hypothetical protein GCM10010964_22790 [Caldovatus sediminis]|uniref:NIPSNAP domain-containing protein n=1 Tax=Caldovatus sediminis TaxID=2041189 RepID=A0A8J2ZB26_9PROT|nr:NIPSNAP family protein [Caldovatus sediminis]GGG34302.1 hypothetical protein GCM10010964_22790 [Caldovatus sediminis]